MNNYPRVKEVLESYEQKGMAGVARYLSSKDLVIEPGTWIEKMKKLLDSKCFSSMEAEIASIYFLFNLSKKDERRDYSKLQDSGPSDRGDISD